MSLTLIKDVFSHLNLMTNRFLHLLSISSSQEPIEYRCCKLKINPDGRIASLLEEIKKLYIDDGKLETYQQVCDYDGTANAHTIYRLPTNHPLIADRCPLLMRAIAESAEKVDPFQFKSAYSITGKLNLNGQATNIKLFSVRTPITSLKHKFLYSDTTFREITNQVLSLRTTMDILFVSDTIYFLSMNGENLFNMERAYKTACQQTISEVEQADIIGDIEAFSSRAAAGHNPRRFLSFKQSRLVALRDKRVRAEMASRFSIPLDANNDKFDASSQEACDRIVKLLCNKGMLDPFNDNAVEVDGARRWQ